MKKDNDAWIFFIFLLIPTIWGALLFAPYTDQGLFQAIAQLSVALNNPFHITWCEDSVRTIFIFLIIYVYGSAKWGNAKKVNQKYADKNFTSNKILSQNVRIGLDGKKHRRNLNTIIIGGSGAGKTRFYGKPNIMQCNTSFVVLDPKGEILRDVGHLLEHEGYVIKVIDLINMSKSHCYNPFEYIQDDKDVLKLITNLIRNTTPKGSQTNDPFWEKSETALLEALCLYLLHEAPKEEQNFTMVMEMIAAADVREDDEDYQSCLLYTSDAADD